MFNGGSPHPTRARARFGNCSFFEFPPPRGTSLIRWESAVKYREKHVLPTCTLLLDKYEKKQCRWNAVEWDKIRYFPANDIYIARALMRNIYMQVSVYKDIWKIYYHTSPISKREKTSATSARKHKLNKVLSTYFYLFFTKEREHKVLSFNNI